MKKYTGRPAYITYKISSKTYTAIHEIKPTLTLNKPLMLDLLF